MHEPFEPLEFSIFLTRLIWVLHNFQNDFVYDTFYSDVQMLGTNSYRSCVTMSFGVQSTFYFCLFLFYSIYLDRIYCYIYQVFVIDNWTK